MRRRRRLKRWCSSRSSTSAVEKLYLEKMNDEKITDDGCAQLASRLRSGALPALCKLCIYEIPASEAAREAVQEVRPDELEFLVL